jgi:hypothetical protein
MQKAKANGHKNVPTRIEVRTAPTTVFEQLISKDQIVMIVKIKVYTT